MIQKLIGVFILLAILITPVNGQFGNFSVDTASHGFQFRNIAVPITLLSLGVVLNNSQVEINLKNKITNYTGENYEFQIDDYLQYAPVAEMYLADIIGIDARNHWFDQTKNLLIANITTSIITRVLKISTHKTRPSGAPYSFPSGHTSFAFCNATVLYKEFEDTNWLLAYSGFAFSTTTGIYRMINNKHWLSDVIFGAGTGILISQLVYHFDPIIKWNPFLNSNNITLIPTFEDDYSGFYFRCQF